MQTSSVILVISVMWVMSLILAISEMPIISVICSHCVKSVRNRSFSGPHFLAFGLNTERYSVSWQNTNQKNSEYGRFLNSASQ